MKPADQIASVAIIGNGLMGQGISQVFARAGKRVTLIGRNPASLERALGAIRGNFNAFVDRGLIGSDDAAEAITRIVTAPTSAMRRVLIT